jgi:hypothetical protein
MLMRLLLLTHPDAGTKNRRHIPVRAVGLRRTIVRDRIFLSRTSEKNLGFFSSHRGFLQPRLADRHLAMGVLGMLIEK